jgi:hypothetical protein
MQIEFKDGRYMSTMWFVEGGDKDALWALHKDPGGVWELIWRFRYYNSPDPFDETDMKSWYHATHPPEATEVEIIKKVDCLLDLMLKLGFGPRVHKLVIRSDKCSEQFAALFTQEWAHLAKLELRPKEAEL